MLGVPHSNSPLACSFQVLKRASHRALLRNPPTSKGTRLVLAPNPSNHPTQQERGPISHHPHSFLDSNPGPGPLGFSPGSSGSETAESRSFCPRSAERRVKVPGPESPDVWSCRGREGERKGSQKAGAREARGNGLFPLPTGDLAVAKDAVPTPARRMRQPQLFCCPRQPCGQTGAPLANRVSWYYAFLAQLPAAAARLGRHPRAANARY